ncbi:MAG: PilZ domain-containing protein [Spirochaetaceae bacterium]|jgi:hypothetical protein|nr:PilZ domain-containing protein [Spirochaetaceae bacterium]
MNSTLFFLQGLNQFQIQTSPLQTVLTLIVGGIIVGVIVFLNVSKSIQNSKVLKNGSVKINNPIAVPVSGDFFRMAKNYGLNRAEAVFLEKVFLDCGIKPSNALRIKRELDENFATAYKFIKHNSPNPEEEQKRMAMLFSIRNVIEFKNMLSESANNNQIPRMYRRKEVGIACAFYIVIVRQVKHRFKTVQKLTVDPRKFTGILLDVSVGGAAVSVRENFKVGIKIKLAFKIGSLSVATLGIVQRINRNNREAVLHVKFLKIPPKSLQSLNEFTYNYKD